MRTGQPKPEFSYLLTLAPKNDLRAVFSLLTKNLAIFGKTRTRLPSRVAHSDVAKILRCPVIFNGSHQTFLEYMLRRGVGRVGG